MVFVTRSEMLISSRRLKDFSSLDTIVWRGKREDGGEGGKTMWYLLPSLQSTLWCGGCYGERNG